MTRVEILKNVIALSVASIAECGNIEYWNGIKCFRKDYRLADNNEGKNYRTKDVFDGCAFLSISDRKRSICGHTSLVNAIKGIIDYSAFRQYLIDTLSSGDEDKVAEIKAKVIVPIFCDIIADYGEDCGAGIVFGCADIGDFLGLLNFCNVGIYINNELVNKAEESGLSREKAQNLVDNGKAEDIVAELKKKVSKVESKEIGEWIEDLKSQNINELKLTSEFGYDICIFKVGNDILVRCLSTNYITNRYSEYKGMFSKA